MRAALGVAIARLRGVAREVAWVAPENLHLTLKFLGQVEEARLAPLAMALQAAAAGLPAFDASVAGLGAFPSATRPRVVWAGVREGAGTTTALAERVERACAGLGLAPETRPFSPHITLGRVRVPRRNPRLTDLLAAGAGEEFGRIRVGSLVLMESRLSPQGARYGERARASLG